MDFLKESIHDLDNLLFIFLNFKISCLAIKLQSEIVKSIHEIDQLSATQILKFISDRFFFFLPNTVCLLKLWNCPTRTNQWPTQSRNVLPTAVKIECFKGGWKHLIMISLSSGKTSASCRISTYR